MQKKLFGEIQYPFMTTIVVVLWLSCVRLLGTSWTTACQVPLSSTISQSLLKLKSIELLMLSNHLILCCPLLFLPSIFPSIRVFSKECVSNETSLWPLQQQGANTLPSPLRSLNLCPRDGMVLLGLHRSLRGTGFPLYLPLLCFCSLT